MPQADPFWSGRRVFLTGHTGFKGGWLSLWLARLGATVTGYALRPPTDPSLFDLCRVNEMIESVEGDVRDADSLVSAMRAARPDIVIHMAAQPLVRESYRNPAETYAVNVIGTVNLLEAVRKCDSVRAVVNVTTDKCYDNREWVWGYREEERLGGYDPYSNSKACSELVTLAYRNSFFNQTDYHVHGVALASARAGNVIGGGDWAGDRLVPDCIRALLAREQIVIRNPGSIRPWQHVLEPLSGYLLLARRLCEEGNRFAEAWNFGPEDADATPVGRVVERLCELWGTGEYRLDGNKHPHEATFLKLDCSKAKGLLGWRPRWDLYGALEKVVEWTRVCRDGGDLREECFREIEEYGPVAGASPTAAEG